MRRAARFLVPAALAAAVAAAWWFDLDRFVSLEALRDNRALLRDFVAEDFALSALIYLAVYAAATAASLPGATVLTVAGGFLFGVGVGGVLAASAATVGATLVFLVARSALGGVLRRRAGPFLRRMSDGFHADAFNYLLFLRLVPIFPFWAVNLVPALTDTSLRVFIAATALGILPAAFVFAAFGAGLEEAFAAGGAVGLADVLNPTLLAALIGLGLLALLPPLLRRRRERGRERGR